MLQRRFEPLALLREHVDQHGNVAVLGKLEVLHQRVEIVTVDRTEIAQAELFEERRLDKEVLRLALHFWYTRFISTPTGKLLKNASMSWCSLL